VTNNLPTGYTIVSTSATVGTVADRAWTIGSLANGASETLTMVVTVLPTGTYPYTVSILGTETDPSTLNNSGLVTVMPVSPKIDLSVSQTVSENAPVVDTDVTFVVSVQNNGLNEATGVTVNDVLGAGYTLMSATPSSGTWSAPVWTIGKMASGAKVDLTIVVKVKETGGYDNAATVSGIETDSNTSNNSVTKTTIPVPPVSAKVTYENDIKPLLVASCATCHTTGYQKKWNVYSVAKANISNIINRVSRAKGTAGFMPQGGEKLSDANIALLNQWVTDGLLEK
jgi:uncharacterized repeat protein (TIGR01451 family)